LRKWAGRQLSNKTDCQVKTYGLAQKWTGPFALLSRGGMLKMYPISESWRQRMATVIVCHNTFRRLSRSFMDTEEILEVGQFIKLTDNEDDLYEGTYLIIQTVPKVYHQGYSYVMIVVYPLSVIGESQTHYDVGSRIASSKAVEG